MKIKKTAMDKTKDLKRVFLDIKKLEPNVGNPNEMGEREFNILYDNIELMGITDPILVREHPKKKGLYRIIGGEHRWDVAKLLGFTEVPCTIVSGKDFSEDQEKFQLVRHNVIHGQLSPQKFMKLFESLSKKYSMEVAAESFGFADEEDFKKLINQTVKNLPTEMQGEFKDAAKEVKTIEGLSVLLNKLFTAHGDTLPWGYMIVDFGGRESIWLRLLAESKKQFMEGVVKICKENGKTVDSFLMGILQLIVNDDMQNFNLENFLVTLPDVVFIEEVEIPSLDFLDL